MIQEFKVGLIRKRIITIVVIIAVLVIAAFLIRDHFNRSAKAAMPKMGPVIVPLAQAKPVAWQQRVSALGTIYARRGVTLRAEVPGRITKVYFASGQTVKKGQPLFQIYPDTLEAQLQQEQAALHLAEYRLSQYHTLYQQGAVSQEAYETALDNRNLDAAKVKETMSRLSLTTIREPFDGIVGLRQVEVGDYVMISQELATFQSKQDLRLDFWVPGSLAQEVHPGQKVTFSLNGDANKTYDATVYGINPLVNAQSGMIQVRAALHQDNIVPGSYAEVTLFVGKPKQLLAIPQTAVMRAAYGDFVYVVKAGKATQVAIHTTERRGAVVGVTKGLEAGDEVITGNQLKVRNGVPVTSKGAIPMAKD